MSGLDRTIGEKSRPAFKVAGLFSGIGGLELPFREHHQETLLLCDSWEPSRAVLACQFPGVPLVGDIAEVERLPEEVDVVAAGFPCTDLSQAGKTAGITGAESGLVAHVFRLLRTHEVEWLILENVRNMLVLAQGNAMEVLTSHLEQLGFSWAYRLVDSRFSGVPQRRHRVLFAASRKHDPRTILFADEAGEPPSSELREDAFGFYWTEGLRGLGWAQDAVPPLKGGSQVGIPSPPAIWLPGAPVGERIATPSIEAAEALQGFERGWTQPVLEASRRNGPRWKLVGNAVTVGVARWLVGRMMNPGEPVAGMKPLPPGTRWPDAAYGKDGRRWAVDASHWPQRIPYTHLTDLLRDGDLIPLSHRATNGFFARTQRSNLRFDPTFLRDVQEHAEVQAEHEFCAARLLEEASELSATTPPSSHALA